MSSTGVRDSSSTEKRVIKGLILNEAQFIQSLRVFANTSTLSALGATGGDSNNSPLEASGNYLAKSGDIMIGQLGNAFDEIAATNIENDTLDVSKTSGVTFPVVILQGELLADDDLVTIVQGEDVFPFQELVIRTRVNIITIKNSDNINTPDGNDLVLPVGSIIHLYFDTFLNQWVIDSGTAFFGGGGGTSPPFPDSDVLIEGSVDPTKQLRFEVDGFTPGVLRVLTAPDTDGTIFVTPAVQDLDFNTNDATNLDRILLTIDSGAFAAITDIGLVADSGGNLLRNVALTDAHFWQISKVNQMSLAQTGLDTVLTLQSTDDGAIPKFEMFSLDSTPTVGTSIGRHSFFAQNSVSANVEYGAIKVDIEDITSTLEDGSLHLIARAEGSPQSFIVLNDLADGKITAFRNIILDIGRNIELDGNKIYTATDIADTFISGDITSIGLFVGSSISAKGTFGLTRLNLENDYFLQTQAVELRNIAGDLTGTINGTMWYNLTTEKFRGRENGADVDLVGGGGVSNEISEGDSSVTVNDVGVGAINFQVDNTALGSITTGLGWVLENDLTLTSGKFILGNGFEIENVSSTTTRFNIPDGEFFTIQEGSALRMLIEKNITFSCDTGDDILFQEQTVTVGSYDGGFNEWRFEEPVRFNGDIVGDVLPTSTGTLGTSSTPWTAASLDRLNLITGGSATGTLLVNSGGIEINSTVSGTTIELKTVSTNRIEIAAEADGGIVFFEPLEMNDEIMMDGGNMIHAFDSIQCGFAVTDEVTSPGSEGTMQMPRTSDTTPSAAELDVDFGDALGCHGLLTLGGLPSTPIYVIKVGTSPSTWRGFLMLPSGTITGTEFT